MSHKFSDETARPIAKIPAELLERVFLHLFDDIVLPNINSSDHNEVSRQQHERRYHCSIAVDAL